MLRAGGLGTMNGWRSALR